MSEGRSRPHIDRSSACCDGDRARPGRGEICIQDEGASTADAGSSERQQLSRDGAADADAERTAAVHDRAVACPARPKGREAGDTERAAVDISRAGVAVDLSCRPKRQRARARTTVKSKSGRTTNEGGDGGVGDACLQSDRGRRAGKGERVGREARDDIIISAKAQPVDGDRRTEGDGAGRALEKGRIRRGESAGGGVRARRSRRPECVRGIPGAGAAGAAGASVPVPVKVRGLGLRRR